MNDPCYSGIARHRLRNGFGMRATAAFCGDQKCLNFGCLWARTIQTHISAQKTWQDELVLKRLRQGT